MTEHKNEIIPEHSGLVTIEHEHLERDERGRFVKGTSGNLTGRPKIPDAFRELATDNCIDALKNVIDICNDPKQKTADRLRAAEIVMDRALGRPVQSSLVEIDADVRNNVLEVVFSAELDKWAK